MSLLHGLAHAVVGDSVPSAAEYEAGKQARKDDKKGRPSAISAHIQQLQLQEQRHRRMAQQAQAAGDVARAQQETLQADNAAQLLSGYMQQMQYGAVYQQPKQRGIIRSALQSLAGQQQQQQPQPYYAAQQQQQQQQQPVYGQQPVFAQPQPQPVQTAQWSSTPTVAAPRPASSSPRAEQRQQVLQYSAPQQPPIEYPTKKQSGPTPGQSSRGGAAPVLYEPTEEQNDDVPPPAYEQQHFH